MEFSDRAKQMKGSATLFWDMKVKEAMKLDASVINLTIGQPDFDTPEFLSQAIRAVSGKTGVNRYANTQGEPELRKILADILKQKKDVEYDESEIIWTSSKEAIFLAVSVLVGKGDEVILLSPCWPTYGEVVNYCDGKAVYVGTDRNFHPVAEEIEKAVNERTKVIIINSPNNPSGAVYGEQEIAKIAKIAKDHDLIVISDEVYSSILFDGGKHISIARLEGMKERTIIIEGFSKGLSVPGFRAGYAAGAKEIIGKIRDLKSNISGNSDSLMQYAIIDSLSNGLEAYFEFEKKLKESFEKRRNFFISHLSIPGSIAAQGAFYLFAPIPSKVSGSMEFCGTMLEKKIGITPGIFFQKEGYARISFAVKEEKLKIAADILQNEYR
ncbi:MAG: aminotransferase class I/II-fold pyridoxal phosphate-dependent enzyme [Candidatus Paceibacterota bacterium]|jgi:aspartate aminotransferase